MTYQEQAEKVGRSELAELHSRRRAHDRQFRTAARQGATEQEWRELTEESDELWLKFEATVDGLLRSRP